MLIVYEASERETRDRLHEEFALIGLEVESREGTRSDALFARDQREAEAVVLLEPSGASIWVTEGSSSSAAPAVVKRDAGETSDMVALRSAELVRGHLLSKEPGSFDESSAAAQGWPGNFQRKFSLTLGPTLFLRTFGGSAPGFTGDATVWFGPVGIGAYAAVPFGRSEWAGKAKDITFLQYSGGLGGRLLLFQSGDELFELQALMRVGVTPLSLRRNKGPEDRQFESWAYFFSGDLGTEATFGIGSWFRLGAQMVGGFAAPINWPIPAGGNAAAPAKGSDAPPGAQGQLTLSAVGVVHF